MITKDSMLASLTIEKIAGVMKILGLKTIAVTQPTLSFLIKSIIYPAYSKASVEIQKQIEDMIFSTVDSESDEPHLEEVSDEVLPQSVLRTDKIQIESVESFVSRFNTQEYSNGEQVRLINRFVKESTAIGKGLVGSVFDIPDTNYVVKVSKLCEDRRIEQLCEMSKNGDSVYKIPFTPSNKTLIMAPNYVSETIIGKILSSESPSFVDINHFYFDTNNVNFEQNATFIIMEKLGSAILPKLVGINEIIYFFLQIFQALSVAQSKFSFVHGHLHMGNVLPRTHKPGTNIKCYETQNGKFLYTYFDYDNVITDFGFSRIETENSILIPLMELNEKASDNFVFNPYLDVFSILSVVYYKSGCDPVNKYISPELVSPQTQEYVKTLFEFFFGGIQIDPDFIKSNVVDADGIPWWLDSGKLFSNVRTHLSNASEMFDYITDLIETSQLKRQPPSTDPEAVLEWLKTNRFYVSNIRMNFNGPQPQFIKHVLKSENMRFSKLQLSATKETVIDGTIRVSYYENFDTIPRHKMEYNLVVPETITNGVKDFSNQNIYIARFSQGSALQKGYSFRFDCCNVETREYFKTTKFSSGIVVNSVFFDLFKKTPIGYYKIGDIIMDNPVPTRYEKYYSYVCINKEGKLVFTSGDDKLSYDQILTCGAVIMKDGKPVFTKDNITATDLNIQNRPEFIFLAGPKLRGPIYKTTFETIGGVSAYLRNVENIKPGELLHGGNPNPRTMIGLSRDGDTVYIIRIEGRDKRGVGMDFIQMGELCTTLGIHNAINLDGGRSSQMCWKRTGDNTIYIAGTSLNSYPVGGVISLVKEL